ncbi:MAG: MarR family transcriptional regulator [Lachnospiraceae bacterium]|jgi:DNA-binding MarR family transcriptional regulator|nr:MarR family transcriptional regulator [Lachnospiraceae bacterium]
MDYTQLALEFMEKMQLLHKAKPKKNLDDALHGEAFVLHFLANAEEEVLPGEIGQAMNVSSARIAQTLNNIEKKGFITRQIDPRDRRKIKVRLTQEGKAEAEKHHQKLVAWTTAILASLGEQDAKEYIRIMGRLAEIYAEHDY